MCLFGSIFPELLCGIIQVSVSEVHYRAQRSHLVSLHISCKESGVSPLCTQSAASCRTAEVDDVCTTSCSWNPFFRKDRLSQQDSCYNSHLHFWREKESFALCKSKCKSSIFLEKVVFSYPGFPPSRLIASVTPRFLASGATHTKTSSQLEWLSRPKPEEGTVGEQQSSKTAKSQGHTWLCCDMCGGLRGKQRS